MPRQVIGKIPEFTQEGEVLQRVNQEGVKEAETESIEEVLEEEKETPPESPTGEKPLGEESEEETSEEEVSEEETSEEEPEEDTSQDLTSQIEGLQREREKLLREIQELRRERRELKQQPQVEQPITQQEIDELKDLHPEDVALIERILRAKGYVRKDELEQELYKTIEQEEINKFLEKYPEFKPENDPDDRNWNALQEELKWYRKPENPRDIGKLLEKARASISVLTGERSSVSATKKRLEIASKGSGGGTTQRSSSARSFTPEEREAYRRGGWSDEEIAELEKNR